MAHCSSGKSWRVSLILVLAVLLAEVDPDHPKEYLQQKQSHLLCKRFIWYFKRPYKIDLNVYDSNSKLMMTILMMTIQMMTMTMMTVGRRYEYTRSNDRMWRKNTVGDDDHLLYWCGWCWEWRQLWKWWYMYSNIYWAHIPAWFPFPEFCLFLGGKPWFNLHWCWFESQLSWRVRLQPILFTIYTVFERQPWCRYGVGASRDPCSEVFQGSHPFSEAESRALRLTNTHLNILSLNVLAKFCLYQ